MWCSGRTLENVIDRSIHVDGTVRRTGVESCWVYVTAYKRAVEPLYISFACEMQVSVRYYVPGLS